MVFQQQTAVSLEKAKTEYTERLTACGFGEKRERISVLEACGRVTAEAVYARICSPVSAASVMDGAAVSAAVTAKASAYAPVTLQTGQYVPVEPGDPIPAGCDAVIMAEELVKNADGSITVRSPAVPWQNVRQTGEDICAGEMILSAYTKVTPAAVGAMIAGGVTELAVIRRPVVGIVPTAAGRTVEDNGAERSAAVLSPMLKAWGAEPVVFPAVPAEREKIASALEKAASECDMLLFSTGSTGRADDFISALTEKGEVLFRGIAMKPGKPSVLGRIGAVPVIGVPGYPVSGIIAAEELARPLIDLCAGNPGEEKRFAEAVLTRSVVSGSDVREFVRVRMGYVKDKLIASPLSRGSGIVSSFMKADGILELPQGSRGFEAGKTVNVRLLADEEKLRNTLLVTGSHDPLLDELADILHTNDRRICMSSVNAGSMGGIMAVRRGEAHAAGCHLLNTEDGSYNISFLRRYFPGGGVKLVRCVGRRQGLMLRKNDSLGIKEFPDVARFGVRFVNRQKGSGTRILTEYLCREYGIDPDRISGWEREELTHTSVAAQIASGSADAGMGIFSAAKLYGLDFVPVCTEQYDLLIPDRVWDEPMLQKLLAALKSDNFKERLSLLGGYTVENAGEIVEYL